MHGEKPWEGLRGRNSFVKGGRGVCTHHLVEAQAALTPRATALTSEGDSLSYEELNRWADRLAGDLRSRGVGPDTVVGHLFERGLEMVVGVLGILKAGSAYLPLAPDYPKDRLRFMLQDSGAHLLLSHEPMAEVAAEFGADVVLLDGNRDRIDPGPRAPAPETRPVDLAYVIYTSGSTGRPKGVQVSHRALVNLLRSMRRNPGLSAQDVWLAVTPLSFDIAGLEILLPLTVGARCEIVGRHIATDGRALSACMAESGATVMQATPSTWHMLLDAGWRGQRSLKALCGGEAMPRELARRLLARCGSLWNLYGPTETTIWSTVERVRFSTGPIYIGQPVRRTHLYVLDSDMRPVLPGEDGELYIGGAGLARGYCNRPESTAERFVANPFGGRPGARLYKTGDLVRRHAGGIEFLGRLDHQVKVRGHRVELGEIDEALSAHPAVRRAVTVAREDGTDGTRLVAYIVQHHARAGCPPPATAADFRRYLAERLPGHMIPSAFVALDALPLTPNGKIDRGSLPAPEAGPDRQWAAVASPRDELEQELVDAWEDAFEMHPIGIDDNFFDLGGDSLLASRLAARIEQGSGQRFALATLIRFPTIRLLASGLRTTKASAGHSSMIEVQSGGSRPPLFCLPGWTGLVDGQGAFSLRRLAELLGQDQPVYTFQCDPRRDDAASAGCLEDLASIFVADLLDHDPHGPYFLAGYSHGALVAFEMARQLAEHGRPIGLLALIDMWGVGFPIKLSRLERWRRKSFAELSAHLISMACHSFREIKGTMGLPAPHACPEHVRFDAMVETYRSSLWMRRFPGRMTLFRASEAVDKPGFRFDEPYNGCRTLADRIEVHFVPGDHVSLMREPHVQALAVGLRRRLQAAYSLAMG